ncbi:MAG: aminocarboxymuconate-semialdehyde decarboxylase, partial [Alphaproteobacteria bacterium]|nr:aminocarboxymuconate-semialdehyde decarboxylase [Alphaproteobacteria bacterium]
MSGSEPSSRERERIIDVQTHFVPASAARLLADYGASGGSFAGLAPNVTAAAPIRGLGDRLLAMDLAGVDVSVLSFAPLSGIADPRFHASLCRAANDGLLEACAAHPDRFVMTAVLPLGSPSAALAELDRIAGEDALRAMQVVAGETLYRPEEGGFEACAAVSAELGLPVLLHPSAGTSDLAPEFDVYGLGSGMHAMVSHALVAARVIQPGMLDRIPRLELVLTH